MVHAYLPPFPPFFAFLLPSPLLFSLPPSSPLTCFPSFFPFPPFPWPPPSFFVDAKFHPLEFPLQSCDPSGFVSWALGLPGCSTMATFGYLVSAEHGRFPHGSSPWKDNTEQQESVWGKACSSHCLAARRQDYKPTLTLERSLENLVLRISHLRNKKLCEMTLETS